MCLLVAFWNALLRFLGNVFKTTSTLTPLPIPVTGTPRVKQPTATCSPAPTTTLERILHPTVTVSCPSPGTADMSPSTASDGSLEIISLPDHRHDFPSLPSSTTPLPSPWSPTGKTASPDVWMTANGSLEDAAGPVCEPSSDKTVVLDLSRVSTLSLYSTSSALDALGITVFVNLDGGPAHPTSVPKLNQVRDENRPTLVTQPLALETPRSMNSAGSVSSLAHQLHMGFFAESMSLTAFQNIVPLIDQDSP